MRSTQAMRGGDGTKEGREGHRILREGRGALVGITWETRPVGRQLSPWVHQGLANSGQISLPTLSRKLSMLGTTDWMDMYMLHMCLNL